MAADLTAEETLRLNPTPKQLKACAICHSRKVRCDLSSRANTQSSCSNCRDAGVECRPHIRKRKHDRVADNASEVVPSKRRNTVASNAISRRQSTGLEHHDAALYTSTRKRQDTSKWQSSNPSPEDEHTCLPTEEQQPSYLGRSDYIAAHITIDEDDATQYRSPKSTTGPTRELEARILGNLSLVEPPQGPLRQSLIRNFMQRCRPWMPLVEESDLPKLNLKNVNCLLTNSMLVAGSVVSTTPEAIEIGHRCYSRAKVLFYTAAEKNDTRAVMATILLQWLNPSGPEHVSIDSSSFWLKISVGLAHQLGLHREPDPRSPDAGLRRRIWWTLVSRDNQIAASHGRPRVLNFEDSNVRPLRVEDFTERDDDAYLFMHYVRITSILGDLTELSRRGTLSDHKRLDIEHSLRQWVKDVPVPFQLHDPLTGKPNAYKLKALQLHIPYFATLIILFRERDKDQPPSTASVLAASFISGIFEEFLTWEDIPYLAPACIFYLLIAGLVQLSSHRFLTLASSEIEEVEIIKLSLMELKKRFPTAIGAERVVNQVIRNSKNGSRPLEDLTLPSEQRDFFAPFGPKLCRKWSLVFGEGVTQPPITPLSYFSGSVQDGVGMNTQLSGDHQQTSFPPAHISTIWPSNYYEATGELPDPESLDVVGRWWWSDWLPELDVPTMNM